MNKLRICSLLCGILLSLSASAATKAHIVSFGKWATVMWVQDSAQDGKALSLKIRALLVDGRVKEYTLGASHEITERLFVVRRAFRINDSLPEDPAPRWQWERGGWLLVDRVSGRVSSVNLPEFDVFYSAANWYRDYAAYCGVAEDGKKTYAMVAQIGRRKPILKKLLSNEGVSDNAVPDSACTAPTWQRRPIRVSFELPGSAKQTFAIRGHVADVVDDADEDEEASK